MYQLSENEKWIPNFEGKYLATWQGEIYHIYPSGKRRQLKGYRKGNLYFVKLNLREFGFNRIIWETFKGQIPKGYLVVRKTPVLTENAVPNLKLRSKSQHGKKTGPTSRSKPVVLLDDDGEIIDSWSSARKAAKDLYVSYQTVMDVCNGKVQKPIINVRWEKKMDLQHNRLPGEFERMKMSN